MTEPQWNTPLLEEVEFAGWRRDMRAGADVRWRRMSDCVAYVAAADRVVATDAMKKAASSRGETKRGMLHAVAGVCSPQIKRARAARQGESREG